MKQQIGTIIRFNQKTDKIISNRPIIGEVSEKDFNKFNELLCQFVNSQLYLILPEEKITSMIKNTA